jgi:hypothetical protein
MQYGSDANVSGGIQDRIDSNLLNNPDGDRVSRLCQRLPDGDYSFALSAANVAPK